MNIFAINYKIIINVFNINMLECYIDSNARGDGGFGSTGV
jgi:dUTPase